MENPIIFELKPHNNQKSFYGKAWVYQYSNYFMQDDIIIAHSLNSAILYSYGRCICSLNFDQPGIVEFTKYWNGYSVTTMKHINSFLATYGIYDGVGGKKWWNSLPIDTPITIYRAEVVS